MAKKRRIPRLGRKQVSIIIDGETEQWYTESMRQVEQLRGLKIKPDLPKKTTLKDLYPYVAKQVIDFDQVIWIIDMDKPISDAKKVGKLSEVMSKFKRERAKLEKMGVIIIVNSPSLERWFLLHFEDGKKHYPTQKPLIDHLRKKYLAAYEKKERFFKRKAGSLYLDLRPNLSEAIARSKAMNGFDTENPERASCEMWKLFEALNVDLP